MAEDSRFGGYRTSGIASVTSTDLSNTLSIANAASNAASVVSARLASVLSTEISTLSDRVSILRSTISARSVGNVSTRGMQSIMDALSNRISVAGGGTASVTSNELSAVQASVNAISNQLSTVSARSLTVSVKGLQSALNAISNTLSNEASVRAGSVQTASAAATSVDSRVNTVSNLVSVLTDSHNALSNVVSVVVSAVSARSVGNVSTRGVQSIVNALSNRISANSVTVSVTSNEVSAGDATLSLRLQSLLSVELSTLSDRVSILRSALSVRSVGNVSTRGAQSVLDALSNRISAVVAGAASATSNEVSAGDAALSLRIQSVLSVEISTLSDRVSLLRSAISVRSVGDVSTRGAQSTMDALSNRISLTSAAVTSVDSRATSIGAQVASVDARVTSVLSTDVSAVRASVAEISLNVLSLQSTVSHLASIVSLVSAVSGGGTAVGLQSVINALSNRISAIPGGGSTNVVGYVSTAQAICAATFTDISGLCISVSADAIYELRGAIMYSVSAATGGAFTLVFPVMSYAAGRFEGAVSAPSGASTFSAMQWGAFGTGGSGSVIWSCAAHQAGAMLYLNILGTLNVNTGGVVKVQARGSVATNTHTIVPGSFIRVFKLR